jgi:hypothetical protein
MGYDMVLLFVCKRWFDFSFEKYMNLLQLKSKASLDQLILIQKVDNEKL